VLFFIPVDSVCLITCDLNFLLSLELFYFSYTLQTIAVIWKSYTSLVAIIYLQRFFECMCSAADFLTVK